MDTQDTRGTVHNVHRNGSQGVIHLPATLKLGHLENYHRPCNHFKFQIGNGGSTVKFRFTHLKRKTGDDLRDLSDSILSQPTAAFQTGLRLSVG